MKTSQLATLAVAVITMSIAFQETADARKWKGFGKKDKSSEPTTPDPTPDPDPVADPIAEDESADPVLPVGYLNAFPTIVRTGTYPTLTWAIDYPKTVGDLLTIEPDGTIMPKEDMDLDVRVVGASYQISSTQWGLVDAQVKVDGASTWTRFWYDTQDHVDPTHVYYTEKVRDGYAIDFRARCNTGSYWKDYRSTGTSTPNVVVLANGDTPPERNGAFSQQNVEEFLRPYLDASGQVQIGPKDLIICFELGQTDTSASGFDQQDLVLLVTFRTKSNNGHGNNVDGIDMSNPGNAPFIPYDTDPTDDDEGTGGGAYPSLN